MAPQEIYQEKLIPIPELVKKVASGDSIALGSFLATAHGFLDGLSRLGCHLENLDLSMSATQVRHKVFSGRGTRILSAFLTPIEKQLESELKSVYFFPYNYADCLKAIVPMFDAAKGNKWVVLSLGEMDGEGYFNFGTQCGFEYPMFMESVRRPDVITVVEINPHIPRVIGDPGLGGNKVHVSEIDYIIEHDGTPIYASPVVPTKVEMKIGENVAGLVDDGATIQIGVGSLGDTICEALKCRKELGVHSEMMTDGIMALHEAGVVTNAHKSRDRGISVCTFIYGTEKLIQWADRNPAIMIKPVEHVNHPCVVSQHRGMTSINTALTVDFRGQVTAHTVAGKTYSGVGGAFEFAYGSQLAENGKSIIMIRSNAMLKNGRVSNILPFLPPGSAVTVPEHVTQWIVTEYGAVNLKGLALEERAKALISIAHPEFREDLARKAREAGIDIDRKCRHEFDLAQNNTPLD